MPLYKVDITIPFTVEAAGKQNIHSEIKKIKWQTIFNQLRALRFIPPEMKYRKDIFSKVKISKIKETGYG
jgi:hypothetical protein